MGILSVMFWNVQYWGTRDSPAAEARRFDHVVDVIRERDPDIASFAEVADHRIYTRLARTLKPGYTIHQTAAIYGIKMISIFKNAAHRNITITQRDEFKGDSKRGKAFPFIRVITPSNDVSILALHTKSGIKENDLAIRDEISNIACTIAQEARQDGSKVIVMGDLNTMGGHTLPAWEEVRGLKQKFHDRAGLVPLYKSHPTTWHGIGSDAVYPDGELDHVFVAQELLPSIEPVNEAGAQLWVGGWALKPAGPDRDQAVKQGSDHAPILFKIRL